MAATARKKAMPGRLYLARGPHSTGVYSTKPTPVISYNGSPMTSLSDTQLRDLGVTVKAGECVEISLTKVAKAKK